METVKYVFYALLGIFAFGIAIYFIFSPFALVVGLFNPHAVLDDQKPKTRIRVLKRYGITSTILSLMTFSAFYSVPAAENSYATDYSMPSTAKTSAYASSVQIKPASQHAARIRTGMTFEQVVSLLGEPDTVLNDEIRESIGEFATGDNLHTFYWQNDKPDCFPISVSFSIVTRRATGIDKGRVCEEGLGLTSFVDPIGESCSGNRLCSF